MDLGKGGPVDYGSIKYGVSRPGIQNKKHFCKKSTYQKKNIEFEGFD